MLFRSILFILESVSFFMAIVQMEEFLIFFGKVFLLIRGMKLHSSLHCWKAENGIPSVYFFPVQVSVKKSVDDRVAF